MSKNREILISLRSEHVEKILAGEKTVELRRRHVNVEPGTLVWIYSKIPDAAVAARAQIEAVVKAKPAHLWKLFSEHTGITHEQFNSYFGASPMGCALLLKDIVGLRNQITLHKLREKVGSFHPPQFYSKLDGRHTTLNALRGGL